MKDNFSSQSAQYAQFRPTYPAALYDYLLSLVKAKDRAWDCGTGNGQVAQQLAKYFKTVDATDISRQQLANAPIKENIAYTVQPAEKTNFPDHVFDLITVAQAIHWFDFDVFYKEVHRTIKNNGILAVIGYNLPTLTKEIDTVIAGFYRSVIGPYWDKERKYIDGNYQTIPFPWPDLPNPVLKIEFEWTLEHLYGYIGTWSAVKHYQKDKKADPLDLIRSDLKKAWGSTPTQKGYFPILLRVAKIEK